MPPVTPNNAGLVRTLTTERLIAALPGTTGPATAPARTVTLTTLPSLPAAALTSAGPGVYGFTRLDDHGRCRDAALFAELGWTSGTRVRVAEGPAGVVQVVADAQGEAALDSRGRLGLPRALRDRLGLTAATPLVLHADMTAGALALLPPAALDAARTLLDASRDVA